MTKEKHQTAAAAKIDPAQLDATLEPLEALKEYVGTEAKRNLIAEIINMTDAEFVQFVQLAEQEYLAGQAHALPDDMKP